MFEAVGAWYLSLFVAIPILLYFMRSVTSKTVTIPSLMLIEKIVKKRRLRQRSLWRLLLRTLIVLSIALAFMRPFFETHTTERLPVYIDGSFSASRYSSQIHSILTQNIKRGIFSHIYYFTDRVTPLYSSTVPQSFMIHDYSVLPDSDFYLISDFQTPYNGKGIKLPIGNFTGNASVINVTFSRSGIRASENFTASAFLQSEQPTDILCSVWINGIKKLEKPVHVITAERVDFPMQFTTPGAYAIEFKINGDEYSADNTYYAALQVYGTRIKYYINKQNYFLESFFEVIGAEKSALSEADIVVLLINNSSDVRILQSIARGQRAFVFAETSRIALPGIDVQVREKLPSGIAGISSQRFFNVYTSSALATEKGTVIATMRDTPIIVYSNNQYYFGFSPDPEASDLLLQPYFYSFMREKIFTSSLHMYNLNTTQKITIPEGSEVVYNSVPAQHLITDKGIDCAVLKEPGILTVRSRAKTQYYAVNVHPDEYITPTERLAAIPDEWKRIELFRWIVLLATLCLILETYLAWAERRRNSL